MINYYQETVVSRVKFTRSARRTVYLYERPKVETRLSDLNNGWADWIDNKLNR